MAAIAHESKSRFLDAALQVIRAKGYEATTIDDLCDAAQLPKGSFFHHFASKEELALAAAGHFADLAERKFAQAPYSALADPLSRLLGYVDFRRSILEGELPEYTCLLGTMVQKAYATHPAIRNACERHLGEHFATLTRDIVEAKKHYAPRARWRADSLAVTMQATIQGAFVFAKARQDVAVADECLGHLRCYLVLLFDPHKVKE